MNWNIDFSNEPLSLAPELPVKVTQYGRPRAWYRDLDRDFVAEEESFLAEKVYGGDCRHERVRVDYRNRFSDRV